MAYQNVGTPRFYVNVLGWLASNNELEQQAPSGIGGNLSSQIRTLPVVPYDWMQGYMGIIALPYSLFQMTPSNRFVAVLGYTLDTDLNRYAIQVDGVDLTLTPLVNGTGSTEISPSYNGFSISKIDDTIDAPFAFITYGDDDVSLQKIGSIVLGTYYDINAPNLSLTMSREYGGTKEFTTHNGSSMSNTMWSKPPKWGNLGAWELGDGNPALAKSGRKTWQLKFSFMDDGSLWGSNQGLSYGIVSYQDQVDNGEMEQVDVNVGGGLLEYNILTDDNFFSQVWHKTLGGPLPFLFQPDSSNNSPDQFCIARFKDNSLKATQSSFNVYDISLSIEEVW